MKKLTIIAILATVFAADRSMAQNLIVNGGFESGYALCAPPGTNPSDPGNTNGPFYLKKSWVSNWTGSWYAPTPLIYGAPVVLQNMPPTGCFGRIRNGVSAYEGSKVINLGIDYVSSASDWEYNIASQRLDVPLDEGDYEFCEKATSNQATDFLPSYDVAFEVYLTSTVVPGARKSLGTHIVPDEVPAARNWHIYTGTFSIGSLDAGIFNTVNYRIMPKNSISSSVIGILLDDVKLGRAGTIYCGNPDEPCSAPFRWRSYSFNPHVLELNPLNPNPYATYGALWEASDFAYSRIDVSHVYPSSGIKSVCVAEFRGKALQCYRCMNICISDTAYPATPSGCGLDFYYDQYSFDPLLLDVAPMTWNPGSTYVINWGDGGFGYVPLTSTHSYATAGTYTVCLQERIGGVPVCTKCLDICMNSSEGFSFGKKAPALTAAGNTPELTPNPTAYVSDLSFSLDQQEQVLVAVFDMTGKKVADVYSGTLAAGAQKLRIDVSDLAGGLYLVRAQIGNNLSTLKLSVTK